MYENQAEDPFCPKCGERLRRGLFNELYCPAAFAAGSDDRRDREIDIELEPIEHHGEIKND